MVERVGGSYGRTKIVATVPRRTVFYKPSEAQNEYRGYGRDQKSSLYSPVEFSVKLQPTLFRDRIADVPLIRT